MSTLNLKVDSSCQQLHVFINNELIKTYAVSTGKNGLGEEWGSEKTPRGKHRICEKIGDNLPVNTVFVYRQPTGEIFTTNLRAQFPERDWIITRILRLEGLEPGKNKGENVDSYRRCIYIHGTPDDVELGTPGSKGCIRMKNNDILELFSQVNVGDELEIS